MMHGPINIRYVGRLNTVALGFKILKGELHFGVLVTTIVVIICPVLCDALHFVLRPHSRRISQYLSL